MTNRIVCVCLIVGLGCLAFLTRSQAQQPAPQEQPGAAGGGSGTRPFGDKDVYVRLKADAKATLLLREAEVRTFGDQSFLTGMPAQMPPGAWTKGLRHWLAMDSVLTMVEFDTEEEFAKRVKEARGARAQPKEGGVDFGGL